MPDDAFQPNTTTNRFARVIRQCASRYLDDAMTIFDIGTGTGPLAIYCAAEAKALGKTPEIHGVDPVGINICAAEQNARIHGLHNVYFHRGEYFEPLEDRKADLIIGDISGVADGVGWALGWYKRGIVPGGGYDGTDKLVALVTQARSRLSEGGMLIFAVAANISASHKVVAAAHESFARIDLVTEADFPIMADEFDRIVAEYNGVLPSFLTLDCVRGKRWSYSWHGTIHTAREPILTASPRATEPARANVPVAARW